METIDRAALGSTASLGDMYDACSDTFLGLSVLRKKIPESAHGVVDNSSSDIQFVCSDKISDKFAKLNINAELQLSVLCGALSLKGSGSYLSDQKTSARSVRCSLIYNVKTKDEKLNIYHDDMKKVFSVEALQGNPRCTHIVAEINWGAYTMLTFEHDNSNNSDVKEVTGKLKAKLEKIKISLSGNAKIDLAEGENDKNNETKFRFYGDVIPKGELPTCPESAVAMMKKVPSLLESTNDGYGKPISYKLIPISTLKDMLGVQLISNKILKSIEMSTLSNVVKFFEEIQKSQQEVHDFSSDATESKYCVTDQELQDILVLKNSLEKYAANNRFKLGALLRKVRAGEEAAQSLDKFLQKSLSDEMSPINIEKQLQAWQSIKDGIEFAQFVQRKGAVYIGAGVYPEGVFMDYDEQELMVLYIEPKNQSSNDVCWNENSQLFFGEMRRNPENYRFFVVDYRFHSANAESSCIIKVRLRGRVIIEDFLAHQQELDNTCFISWEPDPTRLIKNPAGVIDFQVRCPGRRCKTGSISDWKCYICRDTVKLGLDTYLYCECGKSTLINSRYKCSDVNHGQEFHEIHDDAYLQALKNKLRREAKKEYATGKYPRTDTEDKDSDDSSYDYNPIHREEPQKSINILLLGESGVGKSTWINSFYYFATNETLAKAEMGEIKALIPTNFTLYNEYRQKIEVTTGTSTNEVYAGFEKYTTQFAQIYELPVGDRLIRLIDTPGFPSRSGSSHDDDDIFANIFAKIATVNELHGVCIFLNPNTNLDGFRLKKILTRLHRDAYKNIIFCFTHCRETVTGDNILCNILSPSTRETCYKLGNALRALFTVLREIENVSIPCWNGNIFCYDSEAYRYLAAIKNQPPVKFSVSERENFSTSWSKSLQETRRAIEQIATLQPLTIKKVLDLIQTKQLLRRFYRTHAEINKKIEINLKKKEHLKNEIQQIKGLFQRRLASSELSYIDQKETLMETHDKEIAEYKQELQIIAEASSDVARFVKRNSIIPDDDTLRQCKYLNETLAKEFSPPSSPQVCKQMDYADICKLFVNLCELEHSGTILKDAIDYCMNTQKANSL